MCLIDCPYVEFGNSGQKLKHQFTSSKFSVWSVIKIGLIFNVIRVVVSWFLKGTGRDIADFQYGCHCDVNSNHGQLLHGKPVDQIDIGTDFFMKSLSKWYHKNSKVNNIMIFDKNRVSLPSTC